MIWIVFLLFFVFMSLGIPIAFILALVSTVYIILTGSPLVLVVQRTFVSFDSFIFLAIPCFILAGNLMNSGGLTSRLVRFFQVLLGHVRGSLAIITVAVSMVFAGITGSSAADASGVGSILIPAMIKDGYTPALSGAITAAASTLGPIIPPSIAFVVLGAVTGMSVGTLLIAGIIPGILSGLTMIAFIIYSAKKKNWKTSSPVRASLAEIIKGSKDAVLALIAPIIIVGGIISGKVTPTEAAGVSVLYSFICGAFIFKEIKLRDLPKIFLDTAILSSSVMIVCGFASIFGWVLTYERVPQLLGKYLMGITANNPILILIVMNILLLFVGCFLDYTSGILIFAPILLPTALEIGIDPIHFGLFFVFNLMIGLITPPVGTCLYIVCAIAKVKIEELTVNILPYILIMIVTLMFLTFCPALVMFLPNLIMK